MSFLRHHSHAFELSVVVPFQSIRKRMALYRFCEEASIPFVEAPEKSLKTFKIPLDYDIGIVASFGYYMPKWLLDSFRIGSFNVHPSLLPQYRGASPIPYAILNGDKHTGLSMIEIHEKMDHGNILLQSDPIVITMLIDRK